MYSVMTDCPNSCNHTSSQLATSWSDKSFDCEPAVMVTMMYTNLILVNILVTDVEWIHDSEVSTLFIIYAASILSTRVAKLMLHGCMDNDYRNDCWPATYSDWSCTLVYKITTKKTIVCTVKQLSIWYNSCIVINMWRNTF